MDSENHAHGKSADLRSFSQTDIENWFTYHAPTSEQLTQYHEIRTAAKIFAETINRHVPAGADKTATMRKLRDTVMAANAAIACYQAPTVKSLQQILDSPEKPDLHINPDGSVTID